MKIHRRIYRWPWLVWVLGCLVFSLPALATEKIQGPRFALIIGNASYTNFPPLKNPVYDAKSVDQALRALGFKTQLLIDADQVSMEKSIEKFGETLKKGGVGLFYYAGHGIQYKSQNYLIPANAKLKSSQNLRYKTVNLAQVLDVMDSASNDINIVIIDACRNNPLPSEKRSATRGLARVESPKGTLIAYATSPGKTAEDGNGKNGTYTKYLLKALKLKDIPIEITFRRVREGVDKETRGTQTPWESSSIVGDFVINPSSPSKSIVTNIPANKDNEIAKLEAEKDRLQSILKDSDTEANSSSASNGLESGGDPCAASRSMTDSCLNLGDEYLSQGSKYNPKLAINAYLRACEENGNMRGCQKLGKVYASKHGSWKLAQARKYLEEACDGGLDQSCDDVKRIDMILQNQTACKNSRYDSCALLGEVYSAEPEDASVTPNVLASQLRQYIKTDNKIAFEYLKKACNGASHYSACYLMAMRYQMGVGVSRDYNKALKIYKQYCNGELINSTGSKANDFLSCYHIGEMYAKGMGVDKDAKKAYRYFDQACSEHQGANIACEAKADIKR